MPPLSTEAWVAPSFLQMTLWLGLICPLFLDLSLCSFSYQLRMTPALPPSLLPFSADWGWQGHLRANAGCVGGNGRGGKAPDLGEECGKCLQPGAATPHLGPRNAAPKGGVCVWLEEKGVQGPGVPKCGVAP